MIVALTHSRPCQRMMVVSSILLLASGAYYYVHTSFFLISSTTTTPLTRLDKKAFLHAVSQGQYASVNDALTVWNAIDPHATNVVFLHTLQEYMESHPDWRPRKQQAFLQAAQLASTSRTPLRTISTPLHIINPFVWRNVVYNFADERRLAMNGMLHSMVLGYVDTVVDAVAKKIKGLVVDEEMPLALQSHLEDSVDRLMPDVKLELARKTRAYFTPERVPRTQRKVSISQEHVEVKDIQRCFKRLMNICRVQ